MSDDFRLGELVDRLSDLLTGMNAKLATAESCTGGWLAKCLTDKPGSASWFEYGFVTYGNNAKQDLLQVSGQALERDGAVSQAVAEQMAIGARERSGADIAVAITGVAGPDGGTEQKPVGTVWLAWSGPGPALGAELREFPGDRDAVRRQSVIAALDGTVARLLRE